MYYLRPISTGTRVWVIDLGAASGEWEWFVFVLLTYFRTKRICPCLFKLACESLLLQSKSHITVTYSSRNCRQEIIRSCFNFAILWSYRVEQEHITTNRGDLLREQTHRRNISLSCDQSKISIIKTTSFILILIFPKLGARDWLLIANYTSSSASLCELVSHQSSSTKLSFLLFHASRILISALKLSEFLFQL